jgi:hypothetical protein
LASAAAADATLPTMDAPFFTFSRCADTLTASETPDLAFAAAAVLAFPRSAVMALAAFVKIPIPFSKPPVTVPTPLPAAPAPPPTRPLSSAMSDGASTSP